MPQQFRDKCGHGQPVRVSPDQAERKTEADLAAVARRHLEDLSRIAAELGVGRDRLFTHGAGWKEKELLHSAAVNRRSSRRTVAVSAFRE
jgi:hypothetical protein